MNTPMIVIVDDELDLLGLLQDILQDEGYHVVAVTHPGLMERSIAGQIPSLFLIDVMLPAIDGIAVAGQLHAGAYPAIPMVAISASDIMIQRAVGSGWFADTIKKPFDLDSLLGCVARQLAA